MDTEKQTSAQYFKTLSFLHLGIAASQILVFIILYFKLGFHFRPNLIPDESLLFVLLPPLAGTLILFVGAFLFFNKLLDKIKTSPDLVFKMTKYRNILLVRFAILEVLSILALIGFFFTGNHYLLTVTALAILVLVYLKPSKERAATDLGLNQKEVDLIENPDAIIAEITRK